MKEYSAADIRNLALIGHATVGKTSLSEAMLFSAGAINRQGKVDDGSTTSDYHGDEIERKISINASLLNCEWNNCKFNILDTPGYSDFMGDVIGALRVVDCGVVVINSLSGVEVGTENVWKAANNAGASTLFFMNRMDKEHADFNASLEGLKGRFGNKVMQVQLPVNGGEGFDSFVDLIKMTLVKYETNGSGKFSTSDIPDDLKTQAEGLHEQLIEMAAESDDQLLEKFFEEGSLSNEEIKKGLKSGIASQSICPVLCGSAEKNIAVLHLMDFIVEYGTAPTDRPAEIAKKAGTEDEVERACDPNAPLSMLVFKTVSESHLGELSFFRVMSGKIASGNEVMNTSRKVSEKIGQIYVMNGKNRTELGNLGAGDIGATVKLKDTHTGNTLSDKKEPVELKGIDFPAPVIRIAVEPKAKGDEDKISTGLHTLHEQDPTFLSTHDPELSQTIISGLGELHLAIVVKRLKEKFGVDVNLVEPKIPLSLLR